jgi:hypothetical protein
MFRQDTARRCVGPELGLAVVDALLCRGHELFRVQGGLI